MGESFWNCCYRWPCPTELSVPRAGAVAAVVDCGCDLSSSVFRVVPSLMARLVLLLSAGSVEQLLTFINGDHRISVNGQQLHSAI